MSPYSHDPRPAVPAATSDVSMDATAASSSGTPDDSTAGYLRRRGSAGLALLTLVLAIVSSVDAWTGYSMHTPLPLIGFAPLLWVGLCWFWLSTTTDAAEATRALSIAAAGLILCILVLADSRERYALVGMVDAAVCLALASFFPLGWRAQLLPAGAATFTLVFVKIYRKPTELPEPIFTVALGAVVVSLYLARDVYRRYESALVHSRRLRESEEAVRQLNDELDERVEKRISEMTRATRELEDLSEGLWSDLRGPLENAGAAYANLRRDIAGNQGQDSLGFLERGESAVRSMQAVLDELRSFARLVNRPIREEDFDLSGAFEDELLAKRRLDPERDVRITVAQGVVVRGDARMLEEVVRQLVDNAWKFTRERDVTVIEFGRVSLVPEHPTFFLKDNGIGFHPKFMRHLFRPLQRLPGSEDYPGKGVGLARAHRIVFRHGGSMWAQSEPGIGTTVFFYLVDT